MDEDYYLLTLMAVARELNAYGIREADVHLAAGLPLTWVRKQREDFRTYLLRNEYVSFHFNGNEYKLHFVGCSLFPQGYPAIVSRLGDFKGTNLLADIGNGTMNILYINNKKAVESRCWTEKFGVNQCMIAAKMPCWTALVSAKSKKSPLSRCFAMEQRTSASLIWTVSLPLRKGM